MQPIEIIVGKEGTRGKSYSQIKLYLRQGRVEESR